MGIIKMAYSRMGELSDFYIYKSSLGGYDCFISRPDKDGKYHHFETVQQVLTFVELKISEGYQIWSSSLERLKAESKG